MACDSGRAIIRPPHSHFQPDVVQIRRKWRQIVA